MASIDIIYNGMVLDQDSHTIGMKGCGREEFVFDVRVDGSLTVPNFNVVCEGPGVTLKKVGNNVYITIPENVSPKEKNFKLYFSHNMSPSVNRTVRISQPGKNYEVELRYPHRGSEPSEGLLFEADNLFDKDDPPSQAWRIYVGCEDGYCDFGVEQVEEYLSNSGTRIPYDGALSVVKTGNDMLTITSYGRISMYSDVEYRIKLYHKNDRTNKKTITIRYSSDPDSGLDFNE